MKTDLKKEIPTYKAAKGRFEIIRVPSMQFLMLDGHGDPNTSTAYADALATLYPVAYSLKFHSKKQLDRDYVVPPLEALWWSDDMETFTASRDKSRWEWTVMLMVPEWLSNGDVASGVESVADGKSAPSLDRLRFEVLDEGLSVQTLHIGSYEDEAPVLAAMHHDFIPAHGLVMTGRHHEIYLSDPRRVDTSKLRTILRQPVQPAAT